MPSTLFRNGAGLPNVKPAQRTTILDQLQQFAGTINGDPQQMVNQIVQERGVTQEELNKVVNGAQKFMRQFGLR